MSNTLLKVQPSELKMLYELHKQNSCYMQLTNKTDKYVAFKVKTTNPKKYSVRPNTGVVQPGSTCNVTVTMLAPKEIPQDYHCKDKFLVQSVVVEEGTASKDIVSDMFNKAPGKVVEEFKLRVVYIPANPPSPVPEEGEEDLSPRSSIADDEAHHNSLFDVASGSKSHEDVSIQESSEVKSLISRLTEEKRHANEQNQKLRQQVDVMRKQLGKGRSGLSVPTIVIMFILAILIGYLAKRS
ncbi:Vesicle-associated protein 1-1 [Rhynchospora pubera]|uniref:Vesicle-associated protein 1-1 n=1 Tax=Rhynchospora pubera TaxID=906938 RepID=A0AAV8H2X7_9POAL|nr:Vesicle-associated protein 1-1 [Rhynchospora pubera]